jgi:hypothetical protein
MINAPVTMSGQQQIIQQPQIQLNQGLMPNIQGNQQQASPQQQQQQQQVPNQILIQSSNKCSFHSRMSHLQSKSNENVSFFHFR